MFAVTYTNLHNVAEQTVEYPTRNQALNCLVAQGFRGRPLEGNDVFETERGAVARVEHIGHMHTHADGTEWMETESGKHFATQPYHFQMRQNLKV